MLVTQTKVKMAVHSVSSFFSLRVLSFYMLLIWSNSSVSGQHQVIGSSHPVLVKEGDDVILPCHIQPALDAADMTVEWSRPDLKPPEVHLRRNREVFYVQMNPSYKQRTSLFDEELDRGNISLKLSRVQLSDQGTYRCSLPTQRSITEIQLRVGSVSPPVISSNGPKDGGLSLTCDSGCWYPQPEMSWMDSDGSILPAESSVTENRSEHCSTVQSTVMVTTSTTLTCRVHLAHINHTVDTQHVISESDLPSQGGAVVGGIVTLIIILVLAGMGYLYWRKKKRPNAALKNRDLIGSLNVDQVDATITVEETEHLIRSPNPWNPHSERWREQLKNLSNNDCEVNRVGRLLFGTDGFLIGMGNNGIEVLLGLRNDGTEVAVKRMTKISLLYKDLKKNSEGFSHLLKVDDPSIVRYVDFAEDNEFCYLALELCEYNLEEYITEFKDSLSEVQRKHLAEQVLQSLKVLHCQNPEILHRGIKPQNVLIDTHAKARLADFGIILQPKGKTHTSGTGESNTGKQCWMAREMVKEDGEECADDQGAGTHTRSSDIQVAGMLIYYILSGGQHPFGEGFRCESNIHDGIYNLDHVEDEAKDLIEQMINADPDMRPTVEKCLDHHYFSSNQR